ncbi:hypothetical protein [Paraburkholderia gardini]|uniref:Uncharacterized protein n=1 Tax=Paraburkholderia gardini TaxID=2823469 RepID=A0ABN7QKR0_9BURK|nr:hypothetical protein [Paraburkholderia gardini]CAG4890849.1 hypothetical protein R54767_01040 [Paraburkholderia gardini]CAG4893039.1 hypothetical protein R69919_01568 [Paraburkholderia gardini]
MTQIRSLLIGTALTALASSAAFAQTGAQPAPGATAQPQSQMQMPAAQGADMAPAAPAAQGVTPVTPAPQRLVAPGSADPLVQKRDANAQANAEYRASKKASKAQMKQEQKDAKAQYKQDVRNAKINKQADKAAASNEMNAQMQGTQGQGAAPGTDTHQ